MNSKKLNSKDLINKRISTMKRTITITLAIAAVSLLTSPIFSISSDLESSLLEKALIEGAVTQEQKSAVKHYLASVASEKKKLADSYREMAQVNYGGKEKENAISSPWGTFIGAGKKAYLPSTAVTRYRIPSI